MIIFSSAGVFCSLVGDCIQNDDIKWEKKGGGALRWVILSLQLWPKNGNKTLRRWQVNAETVCGSCSTATLAMVQRESYSFFHPCGGTITYCPPPSPLCWTALLTKPPRHNGPSQTGGFGTHRWQPDCWMTLFIQFCPRQFSNPYSKNWISPVGK